MRVMLNVLKKIPGAERFSKLLGIRERARRKFMLESLPQNSVCAEVGVHLGDFSAVILQTLNPKELHLIDPWKHEDSDAYKQAWYGGVAQKGQLEMDGRYQSALRRFAPEISAGRVKVHRDFSGNALQKFPDEYFDWIYIDGNHLYEFIREDLRISFAKTKRGGFIAGDDYGEEGWWRGGVTKAVDEFLKEKPVRLVAIRNNQFVLSKQ
jgi:hypothetical protein